MILNFNLMIVFEKVEFYMGSKTVLLYPMRSMGESIVIGLAASSASKGPQAKTTAAMVSIKVTNCSIQLG